MIGGRAHQIPPFRCPSKHAGTTSQPASLTLHRLTHATPQHHDTTRHHSKATTKVAAKKPVALPPPSGRRQSLRLLTSNKPKPAAASSASSKGKKKGAKGAAAEGSLFDTVKEMISSVLSRFTSSFA